MPQMRAVMSGASRERAAAQQRLEEARRLEDPRAAVARTIAVAHRHVERRPRPRRGPGSRRVDRPSVAHGARSPRGTAGAAALKVRIDALHVASGRRRAGRASRLSDGVFGRLLRPEAAVAAAVVGRAQRAAPGLGHRPQAGRAVRHHHADVAAPLALDADAVRRRCPAGARARKAVITSSSWCLLIGQPRSSKSTGTWSAIGVEVASVAMYSGRA